MHARITQFHIAPDQLPHFLAALEAALPHARQQKGFRGVVALRGGASVSSVDVRVMSIWNSLEDLQAGEQNFYFYQALAKVMTASKGFPLIESQEILFADLANAASEARAGDSSRDQTRF